jgi:hypothetical protein
MSDLYSFHDHNKFNDPINLLCSGTGDSGVNEPGDSNPVDNPFEDTLSVQNLLTGPDLNAQVDLNSFITSSLNSIIDLNSDTQYITTTPNLTTIAHTVQTDDLKVNNVLNQGATTFIDMTDENDINIACTNLLLNGSSILVTPMLENLNLGTNDIINIGTNQYNLVAEIESNVVARQDLNSLEASVANIDTVGTITTITNDLNVENALTGDNATFTGSGNGVACLTLNGSFSNTPLLINGDMAVLTRKHCNNLVTGQLSGQLVSTDIVGSTSNTGILRSVNYVSNVASQDHTGTGCGTDYVIYTPSNDTLVPVERLKIGGDDVTRITGQLATKSTTIVKTLAECSKPGGVFGGNSIYQDLVYANDENDSLNQVALIRYSADERHTSTARGTDIIFHTTSRGNNVPSIRMTIDADGFQRLYSNLDVSGDISIDGGSGLNIVDKTITNIQSINPVTGSPLVINGILDMSGNDISGVSNLFITGKIMGHYTPTGGKLNHTGDAVNLSNTTTQKDMIVNYAGSRYFYNTEFTQGATFHIRMAGDITTNANRSFTIRMELDGVDFLNTGTFTIPTGTHDYEVEADLSTRYLTGPPGFAGSAAQLYCYSSFSFVGQPALNGDVPWIGSSSSNLSTIATNGTGHQIKLYFKWDVANGGSTVNNQAITITKTF